MKSKKINIVCLLVMIIFTLTACSTHFNSSNLVGQSGNDNYNISNDGRIDIDEEYIYYSLNDGLYKCKEDGTDKIKLYNSKYGVYSINVIDDWIYFHSLGIHRIKTDGTNYEQISTSDKRGGDNIIDGKLYNSNNCRMNLDGSNVEYLHNNKVAMSHSLNIVDGWIYFYDEDSVNNESKVFKMQLDGTDLQPVLNERVDYMCVDSDWIYYIKYGENKLYKVHTNGTENQLISEDYANGNMIVKDGWIYYQAWDSLKKVKTDGTQEATLIPLEKICSLQLHGDWLYYNYNKKEDEWRRVKTDGSIDESFAKYGEIKLDNK